MSSVRSENREKESDHRHRSQSRSKAVSRSRDQRSRSSAHLSHAGASSQGRSRGRSRSSHAASSGQRRSRRRSRFNNAASSGQRQSRGRSCLSHAAPLDQRRSRGRSRLSHAAPSSQRQSRGRPRISQAAPSDQRRSRGRSRSIGNAAPSRHRSREPSRTRSLNRSVILQSQRLYKDTDRVGNYNHSSQRHHRLRTPPRRRSNYRSRSPIESYHDDRYASATRSTHDNYTSNELLRCLKESLQTISTANPQPKDKFSNHNVVPEFDPKAKNQTIVSWLNKVRECSEIYGWDSKQTVHYALPKLVGTAKKWYEGQPSIMHTWEEWVEKLKSAFPAYENYGHLLTEMLARRAKFGDDLEEYYYDKLIALNRCSIVGRHAIDCIVYGIDDRSVRYGAEAVGFEDADKLLGYLRSVRHERTDKFNKKPVRPANEVSRRPLKNDLNRVVKCFNCHETGHVVSECKKPIVKCSKCKRIGHNDPACNRNVWVDKAEIKTL